jgi:hypothetical protein
MKKIYLTTIIILMISMMSFGQDIRFLEADSTFTQTVTYRDFEESVDDDLRNINTALIGIVGDTLNVDLEVSGIQFFTVVYTDTIKWIYNDKVYEILLTDDCSEREKLDLDLPLWLYLMYEEECYNDTIMPDGVTFITRDVLIKGGTRGIGGRQYNYINGTYHKQPTFKDFLLWVKDKLKL